ncbi:hypothetical protein [Psychrobacillus sp. L4]|uniref:hypothetical protein n=1 Tax=Psychrobacillus sp. L4 TaxID=3236892 RepID=UPI0036F2D30B
MDDKQLEERLDLLKTTYERVPSSFDAQEVLNKIEKENIPSTPENTLQTSKWQKATVLAVSLASVLIIGILGATFLLDDEIRQGEVVQNDETKAFLDKLKYQYPIEREKRREMLNLPEEEFSQIGFIHSADMFVQHYTDASSTPFIDGTIYTNLDDRYERIMDQLKLPSEMEQEINKGTKLNKAETIEFMNKYYLKVSTLKDYANEKLDEYKDELSIYKVNGLYNMNKILENERNLSKELQNLRGIAQIQGLELEIVEEGIDINFGYSFARLYTNYFWNLDPIANGYLLLMAYEPFTYASELIYPMDKTLIALLTMEDVLLDQEASEYGRMETYYTSVFYYLVEGTMENPVFDENGVVKQEYKEIWYTMANVEANSPSPYLLIPIVKEFEATGWTKSEAWEDFTFGDIEDALHLAKNGDLEQFMPERLTVQKTVNETVVNDDFLQRVQALYKSFAESHDQTVLKDVKPEEIVGLYYYCAQLEDEETKYELYIKDDQYQQIPKEEYMNAPRQKITDLSKEFSSLHFEQRSDEGGYVVLTLHPDHSLFLQEKVIGFAVIHTENGWRAAFMPTQ